MPDLIHDTFSNMISKKEVGRNEPQEPNEEAKKNLKLLNNVEQPLFAKCNKYSNLTNLIKLTHLKCKKHWTILLMSY